MKKDKIADTELSPKEQEEIFYKQLQRMRTPQGACGYCNTTINGSEKSSNGFHNRHKGDCLDLHGSLVIAKEEILSILPLTKGICKTELCADDIRKTSRVERMRQFATALIQKIKAATHRVRKKAVKIVDELYRRITHLIEVLDLPEEISFVI